MSELTGPDPKGLYRVEVYTDTLVSEMRVLIPVEVGGEINFERPIRYFSEASINVNGMQYPIRFEIEADSLPEAIAAFPEAAKASCERFLQELEKRRTEKKIVMPAGILPPVH